MWQDTVIMAVCFGFAVGLVPSILERRKPADSSCIIIIILLAMLAVCFATLELWLSCTAGIVSILAWILVLIRGR